MIDKNRSSFLMSFLDMVFAMLLAVSSLLLLNYILIVSKQNMKVDSKAEVLITMNWDDHSANDMDLWVLTPERTKIGFSNKQNPYMGLERDDLGLSNDATVVDVQHASDEGQLIYKNTETTALRAMHPGRYVVNVHWYSAKPNPVTNQIKMDDEQVEVQLIRVNPVFSLVTTSKLTMPHPGKEVTAFSFDITEDGKIENVSFEAQPFLFTTPPTETGDE